MSSFLKKGLRSSKLSQDKFIAQGVKSWMGKYNDMRNIAIRIAENPDINISTLDEDNINEYAKAYVGRDLDNMEKLLVLGTISDYNE